MNSEQVRSEAIRSVCSKFQQDIGKFYIDHPTTLSQKEAESLLEKGPLNQVTKAIFQVGEWMTRLTSFKSVYLPSKYTLMSKITANIEWYRKPEEEKRNLRQRNKGIIRFGEVSGNQALKPKALTKEIVPASAPEQITEVRECFQELATDGSWTLTESETADLLCRHEKQKLIDIFPDLRTWARMQESEPSQQELVDRFLWVLEMDHV